MITVPGHLIFLETPRTGSRATAEAFMKHVPNAQRSNCRHVHPSDVPRETGLPIYTFTRHPVAHAFSWYKYGKQQAAPWVFTKNGSRIMTFSEFLIAPFCPLAGIEPQRLNIYHSVADHFWPLDWGIADFFLFVLNLPIMPETVGAIRDPYQETSMERRLVEHVFHSDVEIWNHATHSEHHKIPLQA
jgi:hypothetical protein